MFSMTDENWRKQNKTVASRMKVILRQQILTDVVLRIQGQVFKCHRLILAVGSPYFERMFYHTFRIPDYREILLPDVTAEAFQNVLNFLYTDRVTFGNEDQAFHTYKAAQEFLMIDLQSECEIYLSELDFHSRTIWNNLERATALNMEKLRRKYMGYVQKNAHDCLKEDSFLKCSEDIVMKIMQSENLGVSELDLLTRLAAWAKNKNPHKTKDIFRSYLPYIRFRAMTPKDFCNFVRLQPNLLDSNESFAILQYLELPNKNKLPAWCCTRPKRIWPY